jgi:predicted ATPase
MRGWSRDSLPRLSLVRWASAGIAGPLVAKENQQNGCLPDDWPTPMARLDSIRIAGWKSIQSMAPKLELGPINVLIGANGSGKSNLVSFFKLMNQLVSEHLQDYIGQSGGAESVFHYGSKTTSRIEAEMEFETETGRSRYSIHLAQAAPDSVVFTTEELVFHRAGFVEPLVIWIGPGGHRESYLKQEAQTENQTAKVIRSLLTRCRVFHFHDTSASAKIRLSGYIESNRHLYPDGGNLAAMLYVYQQTKPAIYARIRSTLRKIMPMFDDFVLEAQRLNPKYILLNWKQKGSEYLFGPHQLSDGTLRALAIITLFLQPESDLPDVIILDEPELGLHPHAIEIITGLIRAASLRTQVILTTQSTTFLDHFEPEEIIVVDCNSGHSVFRRLEPDHLRDWLEDYSVSELWEKNVLGGGPLP